ncbi:hypothetical protein [Phormidium tenue]|uniref:Uncharacterized protein n=1 Tax=Phormidium tenue FACHB-1050 TaxID=2692857 RepID=A0ABR8CEX6_9CYAN|nr:hypothetical protein [Phormidium tenue]MBD2319151.1 hypothetical protein [Phormidium tenue FACHB-1050]
MHKKSRRSKSVPSAIACPYVVRFRAKHSQIKAICKCINFCGNALPLQFYDQPQTWELLEAIANF